MIDRLHVTRNVESGALKNRTWPAIPPVPPSGTRTLRSYRASEATTRRFSSTLSLPKYCNGESLSLILFPIVLLGEPVNRTVDLDEVSTPTLESGTLSYVMTGRDAFILPSWHGDFETPGPYLKA